MSNPYGRYVDGADVAASLERVPRRIEELVQGTAPEIWERSPAPGKWNGRQIVLHLAHMEMVFCSRLRFGLCKDGYTIQSFDQDDWMGLEPGCPMTLALDAYLAMRRINLALGMSASPDARARTFTHPERGTVTADWLMALVAGHERHHLAQLEAIAAAGR